MIIVALIFISKYLDHSFESLLLLASIVEFLLYGRHEYTHTESSGLQFWSVYLSYGFK